MPDQALAQPLVKHGLQQDQQIPQEKPDQAHNQGRGKIMFILTEMETFIEGTTVVAGSNEIMVSGTTAQDHLLRLKI
jgi:hypothetical protein